MLGFGATGQFAIGEVGFNTATVGWFIPLSEPVRMQPGIHPARQQFIAFDPQPFVSFSWFAPLSEPSRRLPGLLPLQQQFTAFNPKPFVSFGWFEPLSEPVRFKIGLQPPSQQFEARPPQLRPNPTTTGVLLAIETKDVLLAGIQEFNRVVSGEVGIIEASFTGAQIGVSKIAAITSARVSISMI